MVRYVVSYLTNCYSVNNWVRLEHNTLVSALGYVADIQGVHKGSLVVITLGVIL